MWRSGFLMVIIALLVCAVGAYAQSGSSSKGSAGKTGMDQDGVKVTVEGLHYAVAEGGSAAKGSGTKAYQVDYTYGLKVMKAFAEDGQELTNLQGVTLYYLDTDMSERLIENSNRGERLIIKGKLHVQRNALEVNHFEKAGAPWGSDTKTGGSGTK